MRKLKIKGHLIEIYDSIEEMPMRNFHKYNKMLLIDSGIGSDLSDFDRHVARVGVYLKEGKTDDIYNYLNSKKELSEVEKLSAAEGLKLQIKYANAHFTKDDINDVFEEKYSVPVK